MKKTIKTEEIMLKARSSARVAKGAMNSDYWKGRGDALEEVLLLSAEKGRDLVEYQRLMHESIWKGEYNARL